jgi:hypothetical protein
MTERAAARKAHENPAATGRIALLVLASQASEVLEQLAELFSDARFKIYVHLDLKCDAGKYSAGRRWPPNLRFIRQRFEIFWGGFNMVRATEALANTALQDESCRAAILLSDDSLPLRPPSEIHTAIHMQPDRIDVGLARLDPPFLRRYEEFFFMDSAPTSARYIDVENRVIDDGVLDTLARLAQLREDGKYRPREVWSGSQWWSFSREALTAAITELMRNRWVRESFEFSAVPDESVFHTLHANRLGLQAQSLTGPMLTDFTRQPAPYMFSTLSEVGEIPEGKLFLRKVAPSAAGAMRTELEERWRDV